MLQQLFSTPERYKILSYILENPLNLHRVNDIARKLELNKGTVSTYFRFLKSRNIITAKEKGCEVNLNSPVAREIKVLLNVNKINIAPLIKLKPNGVGLYGSWAAGTNPNARSRK